MILPSNNPEALRQHVPLPVPEVTFIARFASPALMVRLLTGALEGERSAYARCIVMVTSYTIPPYWISLLLATRCKAHPNNPCHRVVWNNRIGLLKIGWAAAVISMSEQGCLQRTTTGTKEAILETTMVMAEKRVLVCNSTETRYTSEVGEWAE
ncbi:hypothetical protein LZ30DRAFT_304608 [Colletotrichum cereale]|nr:hypothetical protein LZ30DRAFT_304608 [Colletotrichum cereale]